MNSELKKFLIEQGIETAEQLQAKREQMKVDIGVFTEVIK